MMQFECLNDLIKSLKCLEFYAIFNLNVFFTKSSTWGLNTSSKLSKEF